MYIVTCKICKEQVTNYAPDDTVCDDCVTPEGKYGVLSRVVELESHNKQLEDKLKNEVRS